MNLSREQKKELSEDTQKLLEVSFLNPDLSFSERGARVLASILIEDEELKTKLVEVAEEQLGENPVVSTEGNGLAF